MQTDQYIVAQAVFKSKICLMNGSTFETLFTSIMRKADSNFRPVKPHGQNGDEKNDGFNDVSGEYYQVYSPESPKDKIVEAVKKCKKDFKGLKEFWDKVSPVKGYYFVFNDKYQGGYPEVEKALVEIKQENPDLDFSKPFYIQHLEEKLFSLDDNQVFEIIGYVPNIEKIGKVNYIAMNEVVEHLLLNQKDYNYDENYVVPDFQDKIVFNNLSPQVANLLVQGSYQNSTINDYFRNQNAFKKQKIKEIFSELYLEGKKEFADKEKKDDYTFFYILNRAISQKEKRIEDAVLVLMAYYFESCDIFEEPK